MAVNLSPVGGVAAQFFDNSGNVLTGGKLQTYLAGTTTPAVTYTDSSGATPWSNPIILNASGRVPGSGEIWLSDLAYKFVLTDSNDVLIATYDNVTGINSNFVNFISESEIQTATAGQTVFTLTTMQYQPGVNNLLVFVDGVNQYEGSGYSFVETNATTVTFDQGLHVGALVKFTTATPINTLTADAATTAYTPPYVDSVTTNVETKLAETVSVKDFGAVGDGVTDDSAAVQAAMDSGAKKIVFPYGEYLLNSTIYITASETTLIGYSATISTPADITAFLIGYNGTSFDKTDNVIIEGFIFEGGDTSTSTPSSAISIYPPTTNPYVEGGGCSNIKVDKIKASGYTFGVSGTAADNVTVTNSNFGGMIYHPGLGAGGYGVLLQTCYNIVIESNKFTADSEDRHGIYLSSDPSRTYNSSNVCKKTVVNGNIIDWTNATATTGFESCLVARAVIDLNIVNNIFIAGYGGIDYDLENGPGENVTIANNTFTDIRSDGVASRSAVAILRTAGTSTGKNITITGNTITTNSALAYGVTPAFFTNVTVSSNTISNKVNGSILVGLVGLTNVVIGNNNLNSPLGGYPVHFSGTNDKVLINRNQITGTNLAEFTFITVPTDLKFGYTRRFSITSDGAGNYTVSNFDSPPSVTSATSDTNGMLININAYVNAVPSNLLFSAPNSNVGWIYNRSNVTGVSVTAGVTNHSGVALPAGTNSYVVVGTLLS